MAHAGRDCFGNIGELGKLSSSQCTDTKVEIWGGAECFGKISLQDLGEGDSRMETGQMIGDRIGHAPAANHDQDVGSTGISRSVNEPDEMTHGGPVRVQPLNARELSIPLVIDLPRQTAENAVSSARGRRWTLLYKHVGYGR